MNKIKNHFEKEAAEFDQIMLMLSPYYPQMVDAVVSMALAKVKGPARVLDLGCGSGNISAQMLAKNDQLQITCLDISDNMLDLARNRLSSFKIIDYINAKVEDYAFDGVYDVVISSLALHHVQEDSVKQEMYKRIYSCLNEGGAFFNADITTTDDPHWQEVYTQKWKDFMLKSVSLDEIENKWVPRHEEYDSPKHLTNELDMLKQAGFKQTDVAWKYFMTTVYGAIK